MSVQVAGDGGEDEGPADEWRPVISLGALSHRLSGVGDIDQETGEAASPTLVVAVGTSIVLALAACLITLVEHIASPARGRPLVSVARADILAGEVPAFPALSDPAYWIVVGLACIAPITYTVQLRQCEKLFGKYPAALAHDQEPQAAEALRRYQGRLQDWGTWWRACELAGASLTVAILAARAAFAQGPLPAIVEWTRHTSGEPLTESWWLNPGVQPATAALWMVCVTYLVFVLLRQGCLMVISCLAVRDLRKLQAKIDIDLTNADGAYGLGLIRGCLLSLTATCMHVTVAVAAYSILMIGSVAGAVAVSCMAAGLAIATIWIAMVIVSRGVAKGKRSARSARTTRLVPMMDELKHYRDPPSPRAEPSIVLAIGRYSLRRSESAAPTLSIEGHIVERSDSQAGTDLDSRGQISFDRFTLYRAHLLAECDLIDSIPSTGFRIREFLYACASLIGVPVTVAALTAVFG